MNPIINDPTVKKYFGCGPGDTSCGIECAEKMAIRVLDAMCAPMKKGERGLYVLSDGTIKEITAFRDFLVAVEAPFIRLPDAHQEPDYEKELADRRYRVFLGGNEHAELCAGSVDGLIDLARKAERQKMERETKL